MKTRRIVLWLPALLLLGTAAVVPYKLRSTETDAKGTSQPPPTSLGLMHYTQHEQTPVSPMQAGIEYGPAAAWPLTHPKICGGIILTSERGSEASLSAEQARNMLPLLHALGYAWQQAIEQEAAIRAVLTPQQRRYVFEHKAVLEDPHFIEETFPSGDHLQACHDLLARRAEEKSPERIETPEDPDAADDVGIITFSDMLTGIYVMEDEPGLAVDAEQAARLALLYRGMDLSEVKRCERELSELLTAPQVKYIQDHIEEISRLKRDVFSGDRDTGFYGDPLIWKAIQTADRTLES